MSSALVFDGPLVEGERCCPRSALSAETTVGPEVVREGLAVLADVAEREGFKYDLVPFDIGGERYLKTGEVLPDKVVDDLRRCDALFLGRSPDIRAWPLDPRKGNSAPPSL